MDMLKAVRAQSDCFLLLISAQASELECILALELGGDDYIGGPFSLRQLVAKVKALFRRLDRPARPAASSPKAKSLRYGGLRLDIASGVLSRGKLQTSLTISEVFILEQMMVSPTRIFTREELLQESLLSRDGSRAVDMHIANLRKKISNLGVSFAAINAVRGKGYRFRDGTSTDGPSRLLDEP
jgi:two-component system alkaline phosphatase synthesis response regulator PhoP